MSGLSITATTRTFPKLPYAAMKNDVLGAEYSLSLVFIGATRAQKLNQTYRKKSYVPNVLSFPLTKTHGEIFITPSVAKFEANKYNLSTRAYIGYLYIHALLHLKGYTHGAKMDKAEIVYSQKYSLK